MWSLSSILSAMLVLIVLLSPNLQRFLLYYNNLLSICLCLRLPERFANSLGLYDRIQALSIRLNPPTPYLMHWSLLNLIIPFYSASLHILLLFARLRQLLLSLCFHLYCLIALIALSLHLLHSAVHKLTNDCLLRLVLMSN